MQARGSNAPSDHTLFNWFHKFQHNKFSVQDAPRSGHPSTFVTEQTIDAARKIIEDDPHSTYQQIEAILCISSTPINSIIHDYLNLRKVCGRWMPHTLIDDQKQLRVQFCRHSLKRFEESDVKISHDRVFTKFPTIHKAIMHKTTLPTPQHKQIQMSWSNEVDTQIRTMYSKS